MKPSAQYLNFYANFFTISLLLHSVGKILRLLNACNLIIYHINLFLHNLLNASHFSLICFYNEEKQLHIKITAY